MNSVSTRLGLLVIFFLQLSCNDSALTKINKIYKPFQEHSNVYTDIAYRYQLGGTMKSLWDEWRRTLNIPIIDSGFKKFQMRIWQDFFDETGRIVVIRNVDNDWSAELWKYQYFTTNTGYPDSLSGSKSLLSPPNSGWNNLINKMIQLDILTLPDCETIQDYDIASDELAIIVEIASVNYYRLYGLMTPQVRVDKFPSARKMVQILNLMQEEFNLEIIKDDLTVVK